MLLDRRKAVMLAMGGALVPFADAHAAVEPPPAAEPEEAPMSLQSGVDSADHMTAPVFINGQGPFPFLIDTGANISCVSTRLAARLQLEAGPPREVHTVVGSRSRPSVLIDHLRVGDRNRTRVKAPSLTMGGSDPDGVLGVDWLKGQRLSLGFKDKLVEITASRRDVSAEGKVVVPARRRWGQLTIVDADLGEKRISAIVDSGAELSMCNDALRRMVAEQATRRGRPEKVQTVGMLTLAGEAFTGELFYLPFLRLGGLQLGNVPVVHTEAHVFDLWGLKDTPTVILGMDLLRQFSRVTLDFGHSNVRFDL